MMMNRNLLHSLGLVAALTAGGIVTVTPAQSADPVLIVQGDRLYLSTNGGDLAKDIGPAEMLEHIHRMPGNVPGPPSPEPPDEPPAPVDLQAKVQTWAEEIGEPGVAAILADTYRFIARQVESGRIAPTRARLQTALRLIPLTLDELEDKGRTTKRSQWESTDPSSFTGRLGMEINAVLRREEPENEATVAETVAMFNQIADGLDATHAGQALPPWVDEFLQTLLTRLLDWLLDLLLGLPANEPVSQVPHMTPYQKYLVETDQYDDYLAGQRWLLGDR